MWMFLLLIFLSSTILAQQGCNDYRNECSSWTENGACVSSRAWMEEHCPKSCGFCKQSQKGPLGGPTECFNEYPCCTAWETQGKCKTNSQYIRENCKAACGVCTPNYPTGGCRDYNTRHCAYWAKTGQCRANKGWMEENCRKSCNLCTMPRSSGCGSAKSTTSKSTSTTAPTSTTPPPVKIDRSVQYQNHMTDLLSGLKYMLWNEIATKQKIKNVEMTSLKTFVNLLDDYFPGSYLVQDYLHQLKLWLSGKKEVTGEEWVRRLDLLQKRLNYPLPKDITWVACKGSKPKYRGYPCGLWSVLHTLTVQAYIKDGNSPSFSALDVLEAIHVYIRDFFGCEECVKYFENGASKLPEVVKKPKDVVIWLWRSHNIPNKWLANLPNEDPLFPKVQWPPPTLCQQCHNSDGTWNEDEVFDFVTKFYNDIMQ